MKLYHFQLVNDMPWKNRNSSLETKGFLCYGSAIGMEGSKISKNGFLQNSQYTGSSIIPIQIINNFSFFSFPAFCCTFFEFFNIPVFWPILVMYFITLFCITMKRQIKVNEQKDYIFFLHLYLEKNYRAKSLIMEHLS